MLILPPSTVTNCFFVYYIIYSVRHNLKENGEFGNKIAPNEEAANCFAAVTSSCVMCIRVSQIINRKERSNFIRVTEKANLVKCSIGLRPGFECHGGIAEKLSNTGCLEFNILDVAAIDFLGIIIDLKQKIPDISRHVSTKYNLGFGNSSLFVKPFQEGPY